MKWLKAVLADAPGCNCCGGRKLGFRPALWEELIRDWQLDEAQARYIDRQQGTYCLACGVNLRAMALAAAVMRFHGFEGTFAAWAATARARDLDVLEVNRAGELTQYFQRLPRHRLVEYPQADIARLPFEPESFDLVVHSDTLEHVPDPVRGLAECRRVLKPGGGCAYTVPIVVERLTASRDGKPPSYHGLPGSAARDYLVRTEYGADAWTQPLQAGFGECRIVAFEFPAALALLAVA